MVWLGVGWGVVAVYEDGNEGCKKNKMSRRGGKLKWKTYTTKLCICVRARARMCVCVCKCVCVCGYGCECIVISNLKFSITSFDNKHEKSKYNDILMTPNTLSPLSPHLFGFRLE